MKRTIGVLLVLAMVLCLCACGSEKGYTVRVVDENGVPVAGAMVQLCKDACVPGMTDAEGTAYFDLPADDYKVAFAVLPAGYAYVDGVQEFCFEKGSRELTITLKAAE